MINNLFSIFDPSTSPYLSINWFTPLLCIRILPLIFWLTPSNITLVWIKIILTLKIEINAIIKNNLMKNSFLIISVLILIILTNFFRLTPYIFTNTAHLTISLSLSLPLWVGFIIFGWSQHTQKIFTHLVPQGTPPILIPFMVLIETTRNVIRPLTLAVRLTANIIAGHLLLTLLSSTGPSLNLFLLIIMLITQCLLLRLEIRVALIQAYVFSILRTLYCSETYEYHSKSLISHSNKKSLTLTTIFKGYKSPCDLLPIISIYPYEYF